MIEKGELGPKTDPKVRGKRLVDDFGWEKNDSQKIWTFGPDTHGANMLVDTTKGVQYLNEI